MTRPVTRYNTGSPRKFRFRPAVYPEPKLGATVPRASPPSHTCACQSRIARRESQCYQRPAKGWLQRPTGWPLATTEVPAVIPMSVTEFAELPRLETAYGTALL